MDMSSSSRKVSIPASALQGSLRDYRAPTGPDLVGRTDGFFEWQDLRRRNDVWPYARSTETAPATYCKVRSDADRSFQGINFASQDYLSLSSHPRIKQAAIEAVERYGVHSAGSAALLGNTANSLDLEAKFSDFLGGREVVLYPTGWSAGFASVQGFVRPDDHVVMDVLAHSCLQEGARAATQNIYHFAHLNTNAVIRRLSKIREKFPDAGILVVTESLFSMHADMPDFAGLRQACDTYGATLLIDCAHDLGAMGPGGLGNLGTAGMLDAADILIGSFSKSFASNGGFVSVKTRAAAEYLKYFSATQTFSNALSPVQAAVVGTALDIIRSDEGEERRQRLMDNILYLRKTVENTGLRALGLPSPIVPVFVGSEALGRLIARRMPDFGGIANLVEYPAVPKAESRFRFQVMADHTRSDVDRVVVALGSALEAARTDLELCVTVDQSPLKLLGTSTSAAA